MLIFAWTTVTFRRHELQLLRRNFLDQTIRHIGDQDRLRQGQRQPTQTAMLRKSRQQSRLQKVPMLAAGRLTSPLPRRRLRPIARVRRPPVLPIQNKRVRTGGVQPTELVGRTIDRDCVDVMSDANRGELDGTV
jgi:hypothetical protein